MSTNSHEFDRDRVILAIRQALKIRSGREWSVTGGRGTAWGWIQIDAPPRRRTFGFNGEDGKEGPGHCMSMRDRVELGRLLGLDGPIHPQGDSIPASRDYRRLYLNRAIWGDDCGATAEPYWD